MLITAGLAGATDTGWWVVDTAEEFLKGRGDGVAVSDDGRLRRVARWQTAVSFEEPVLMAGTVLGDGSLVVGSGYPGRLYRVKGRSSELLTDLPAEQVSALLATPDGSVLVATVAPGALYRWHRGELTELGRLDSGSIWDLAEFAGSVVAAAGPPATLYRIADRGLERWLELPDTHARCLAPGSNTLVVGTSGQGLILAVHAKGELAVLADSPFTEISDLVVASDGSVWAAALVGEPSKPTEAAKKEGGEAKTNAETSTVELDLPKVNGATASSEVLRLTPEGALLGVHRFTKQVATALAWDGAGTLVGTGFEGEVWRFVPSGGARLATVDAVQVVAMLGGGASLLTQGPGAVLRRYQDGEQASSYRIDGHRFPRPVSFGEYRIDPPREDLRIRFRSGVSEKPSETWLPWSDWQRGGSGVVPLPAATSLQWEVELPAASVFASEGVERVEVAYREVNLAPRLAKVEVEEPGVVYLAAPPPSGPVIDLAHPDFSGIFTTLDDKGQAPTKPKQGRKYWRVGFRTVSWEAEDPNEDPLLFTVELERRDGFRLEVRTRLETTQLAVDTSAVPDGSYRFRITTSDVQRNPGAGLETVGHSHWFVVDSTPPVVEVRRQGGEWVVVAKDAASPIARAEWSRDGERWNELAPDDGVLDGREEVFRFPATSGRHLVVVRAIDRHHNRTVAEAVEE